MRKVNYVFLILLIFVFLTLVSYLILKHSQLNRINDETGRLLDGLDCYNLVFKNINPPSGPISKLDMLFKVEAHPLFYGFLQAASWKILDLIRIPGLDQMILLTNSLLLLILLFSVYGIGSIIYTKKVGFLAALLVSLLPLVFAHTRIAMLDFPLTALVSLSILILLKTDHFRSVFYSICFGIVFALSQLTKETALFFVIPPLIYSLVKAYSHADKKRAAINCILALTIFFVLAGSAYLNKNNPHVLNIFFLKLYLINYQPSGLYYLTNFIDCTGPLILFPAIPLFLSYLVNIKKREKLFFFWFFIPLILFTFTPNKHPRFILPILPAFALIIVQEIFTSGLLRRFNKICVIVLVFFSVLQYGLFNSGAMDYSGGEDHMGKGITHIVKEGYTEDIAQLFDLFKKEVVAGQDLKWVIFMFHVPEIICPLAFQLAYSGLPFCIDPVLAVDESALAAPYPFKLLNMDYVFYKPRGPQGISMANYNIASQLKEDFAQYKDRFKVIAELELVDGSIIYVYKRKNH